LSLASGIAVVRALEAAGASGLLLKWPNDVMLGDRKLGGILVDVDGDCRGPMRVVVGIGLNLRSSAALRREVAADGGRTPGGLDELLPHDLGRNQLAAGLLNELVGILRNFSASGFAPLADEWFRHDYLRGRSVTVSGGSEQVEGIVRGIAADGALLVEASDGTTAILAGEVSVRQAK
jgi:BirA family biotin operon repressor/biotin-[acetyl-CoA-carboxylase] ligase